LVFSLVIKEYQNFNQQKLIIYNINKCSAYDFINGRTSLLLADSIILADKNIQDNSFTPNRIYCGINRFKNISLTSQNFNNPNLYKKNNFIQFLNRHIVVIDKSNAFPSSDNIIKIDYLIIRQNPQINIEKLISQYQQYK